MLIWRSVLGFYHGHGLHPGLGLYTRPGGRKPGPGLCLGPEQCDCRVDHLFQRTRSCLGMGAQSSQEAQLPIHLSSIYLSIYPSIYLSTYLCLVLHLHLDLHLHVDLYLVLYVYLHIYISVSISYTYTCILICVGL